jgi:hypothetical protein
VKLHSPPTSGEVKETWIYTFPHALSRSSAQLVKDRNKFTFMGMKFGFTSRRRNRLRILENIAEHLNLKDREHFTLCCFKVLTFLLCNRKYYTLNK